MINIIALPERRIKFIINLNVEAGKEITLAAEAMNPAKHLHPLTTKALKPDNFGKLGSGFGSILSDCDLLGFLKILGPILCLLLLLLSFLIFLLCIAASLLAVQGPGLLRLLQGGLRSQFVLLESTFKTLHHLFIDKMNGITWPSSLPST